MRGGRRFVVIGAAALAIGGGASAQCPGDCNDDGAVAINELIRAVSIALRRARLAECAAADANGDGHVRITDLVTAVNAALGGCPPPSSPAATATASATPTQDSRPPVIEPMFVFRAYPGYPIEYVIPAHDPDGGGVRCESSSLPAGASLDATSRVLSWTPSAGQVGGFDIPIRCFDEAGASVSDSVPVRITPLDSCSQPTCDSAAGCRFSPLSIADSCCAAEPAIRVREPTARCTPGIVLYAGRNERGFGRLQNCDRLRIRPSGQGSTDIFFNIETRCVDSNQTWILAARMESADEVLFERELVVSLSERGDGFAWQRALFYRLELVDPATLDGTEVQLHLRLKDAAGVETITEHVVRLVLTTSALGDLPEPDSEDIPADEAGCVGCHRPLSTDGGRFGIEVAHPWAEVGCTDCHGGDATAFTRTAAHVLPSSGPAYLKTLAVDQLDDVSAAYLRFVNPGDLRVAPQTCGRAGCHSEIVEAVRRSAMATNTSLFTVPRYLAAMQDAESVFAALDILDPRYSPVTAPPGTVGELQAMRGATGERWEMEGVVDEYLAKACPTCHLNNFGRNDAVGLYRSSGCTACHMVYADDGRSRSADPMIIKSIPSHPLTHTLTSVPPVEQCAHCHNRGGRIGLAYRGIREGGFPPQFTPALGQTIQTPLYGNPRDYYFVDENILNTIDETPPDLHFTAGLVCVDCHVGVDVHGDGHMSGYGRDVVGVRCEDCHGTIRQAAGPDGDGVFRNSAGEALRRLRRDAGGAIRLRLAADGRELSVPQIAERVAHNPRMMEAMGVGDSGFSHTDVVECHTCHSTWRQACFGCHVGVDDRGSARNWTTGAITRGAISERRDATLLDFLAVGVNARGKWAPLAHSMSTFFSYIDTAGVRILDDMPRRFGDGQVAFGWSPFFHHTVSRVPQNCDRCHSVGEAADPDNAATLRETYGFGNDRVTSTDGRGLAYDPTAFLDAGGDLIGVFPKPSTGPVPASQRQRAVAIAVTPQPR